MLLQNTKEFYREVNYFDVTATFMCIRLAIDFKLVLNNKGNMHVYLCVCV